MTTPVNVSAPRSTAGLDSAGDWLRMNGKPLGIVAAAALVVGGGFWFYRYNKAETEQRAEREYYQAEQSLYAGNLPLAQSDLQKVDKRYEGTRAADQARLSLAQALYGQRKFKEGVDALQPVIGRSGAAGAAAEALVAAGYEEQNKPGDAATHYRKAADAAELDVDKSVYLADAARAYSAGNGRDSAVAIWTRLSADLQSPVAAEARVRLGELLAKPIAR